MAAVAELKAGQRDVVVLDRQRVRHELRATLKLSAGWRDYRFTDSPFEQMTFAAALRGLQ